MPFIDIVFPQVTATWTYQMCNHHVFVGKYKSCNVEPTRQFTIQVTPEDEHTDEVPLVTGILLVPLHICQDYSQFPFALGYESHTKGNWQQFGLKKDYDDMYWSYRFVSNGKQERVTRELPVEFKQNENEREWGVYVGIIAREPLTQYVIDFQSGQAIMGHILHTSATVVVARRVYNRNGNIPDSTDKRRHRKLRPKEERHKEKNDKEAEANLAHERAFRKKYRGTALDFGDPDEV